MQSTNQSSVSLWIQVYLEACLKGRRSWACVAYQTFCLCGQSNNGLPYMDMKVSVIDFPPYQRTRSIGLQFPGCTTISREYFHLSSVKTCYESYSETPHTYNGVSYWMRRINFMFILLLSKHIRLSLKYSLCVFVSFKYFLMFFFSCLPVCCIHANFK